MESSFPKNKKASLESQWLYCILLLWNSHQQAVRWVQSKQGLKIVLGSWCSQQTSIVPNIIGIEIAEDKWMGSDQVAIQMNTKDVGANIKHTSQETNT